MRVPSVGESPLLRRVLAPSGGCNRDGNFLTGIGGGTSPRTEVCTNCTSAAEAEVERCLKEDMVWKSAKLLFDTAIRAHMELHALDRETPLRLLRDAAEVTD